MLDSLLAMDHLLLLRYLNYPKINAGITKYGARVGYEGPFLRIWGHNHSSVLQIPCEGAKRKGKKWTRSEDVRQEQPGANVEVEE